MQKDKSIVAVNLTPFTSSPSSPFERKPFTNPWITYLCLCENCKTKLRLHRSSKTFIPYESLPRITEFKDQRVSADQNKVPNLWFKRDRHEIYFFLFIYKCQKEEMNLWYKSEARCIYIRHHTRKNVKNKHVHDVSSFPLLMRLLLLLMMLLFLLIWPC